jgi:predicted transcriptional regulator
MAAAAVRQVGESIQSHKQPRKGSTREPYRGDYQIANDILTIVCDNENSSRNNSGRRSITSKRSSIFAKGNGLCKPLDIVYGCRLTWDQFKAYRDMLVRSDLLIPLQTNGQLHYKITPKGFRYLQVFAEIEDDLRPSVKD